MEISAIFTASPPALESVAFRYFRDRMPLMIAKQIIRIAAKVGLQEGGHAIIKNQGKTEKNNEVVAILALVWDVLSSIWNVVSEQADLRCWRNFPCPLKWRFGRMERCSSRTRVTDACGWFVRMES